MFNRKWIFIFDPVSSVLRSMRQIRFFVAALMIFFISAMIIKPADAAPSSRMRGLCESTDGMKYFSTKIDKKCLVNVREDGWTTLIFYPNIIVDYSPASRVQEADGVKVWLQFFLSSPSSGKEGVWNYNSMRGVTKFYCGRRQIKLMQATYIMDGKTVYERLVDEAIMEELEPGTVNEELYAFLCIAR